VLSTNIIEAQISEHSETLESNIPEKIKIGFLIPDSKNLSAKYGAELAIQKANENGGYSGNPFQLIIRSTEGPWGAGSKESVSLVFEDKVLAIIGSLDGRNAHLAEQVAAKTKIAFLSTQATDMTLSQAFVPWYFRCVPNDVQQAISLIHEIYKKTETEKVAIISTNDYDSKHAVAAFLKVIDSMNIKNPKQFLTESSGDNFTDILTEIENSDVKKIVLFGDYQFASEIISAKKQKNMMQPIYGSLSVLYHQKESDDSFDIYDDVIIISSNHWFTDEGVAFQKEFVKNYGYNPGVAAAFAYDGVNIIIEAIKNAGTDHDDIIDELVKIKYKTGVTGNIQFDVNGNRIGNPELLIIKNGNPVEL
jgi:branched-chain amino acid transport system substrate-binding protein